MASAASQSHLQIGLCRRHVRVHATRTAKAHPRRTGDPAQMDRRRCPMAEAGPSEPSQEL